MQNKTINFVNKANVVHNRRYLYDDSCYINNKTKIKIFCKKHGYFYQTPGNHLFGQGCPKCSVGGCYGNLTNDEFIKRCLLIYLDKYDYSKTHYKNSRRNITIICKIHGEFEKNPSNFLNGFGCKKCGGIGISNFDEFKDESSKTHINKYVYDKVDYKNNYTKIIITCPDHGDFTQLPSVHLKGQGCPKCCLGGCYGSLGPDKFIKKSNFVHNNKYTYDKIKYKNNRSKVIITCKEHGDFEQKVDNHLNGQGCPRCSSSKGEMMIEKILSDNNIKYTTQYSFNDLKYKSKLRFDFAILNEKDELNLLIEFNGEQHYRFIEGVHRNIDNYNSSLVRDNLKIDYCKNNNIKLYIVKYDDDIYDHIYKIIDNIG